MVTNKNHNKKKNVPAQRNVKPKNNPRKKMNSARSTLPHANDIDNYPTSHINSRMNNYETRDGGSSFGFAGFSVSSQVSRFLYKTDGAASGLFAEYIYLGSGKAGTGTANEILIGAKLELLARERKPDGTYDPDDVIQTETRIYAPHDQGYNINVRKTIIAPRAEPVFVEVASVDIADIYDKGFKLGTKDFANAVDNLLNVFQFRFLNCYTGAELTLNEVNSVSYIFRVTTTFASPVPHINPPAIACAQGLINGVTAGVVPTSLLTWIYGKTIGYFDKNKAPAISTVGTFTTRSASSRVLAEPSTATSRSSQQPSIPSRIPLRALLRDPALLLPAQTKDECEESVKDIKRLSPTPGGITGDL